MQDPESESEERLSLSMSLCRGAESELRVSTMLATDTRIEESKPFRFQASGVCWSKCAELPVYIVTSQMLGVSLSPSLGGVKTVRGHDVL